MTRLPASPPARTFIEPEAERFSWTHFIGPAEKAGAGLDGRSMPDSLALVLTGLMLGLELILQAVRDSR